jgi:hypothetical protein
MHLRSWAIARRLTVEDVADLETDDDFRVANPGQHCPRPRHDDLPVKAVEVWMRAAGISEGAQFHPVAKDGRRLHARISDKSVV